ncbi:Snx41 protein [Maudiozyma humilis]|uniref:Snx41 protein n=1 Tax=Maudiozyma humilis TaxID=51915 RepID=A0AAV5RPL4_MAUHU|nr:Snx41 protein [Kazachstania humilis]
MSQINIFDSDTGSDPEEEENNNPFAGTDHMFASGVAAAPASSGGAGFDALGGGPGYEYPEEHSTTQTTQNKESLGGNDDDNTTTNSLAVPLLEDGDNTSSLTPSPVPSSQSSSDTDTTAAAAPTATSNYEPYENLSLSVALAQQQTQDSIIQDQRDWEIKITDSGDFSDQWGKKAVGYVIDYNNKEVIRRYSEFSSLHSLLIKFFPTIVVPPIPSKHSLMKYFLNPINAQHDTKVIEKRKRKFASFLNNCNSIPEIKSHIIFQKFLDPECAWKDVINHPPVTILPENNLLAPPLNQTKPSPLHPLLPTPNPTNSPSSSQISAALKDNEELQSVAKKFTAIEGNLSHYLAIMQPMLNKIKHNKFHMSAMSAQLAELGAFYNALSIGNIPFSKLSSGIEKVGHAFDVKYVSMEIFIENFQNLIEENVDELVKLLIDARRVIVFKNMKLGQYQIVKATLDKRNARLKELREFEDKLNRLDVALNRDAAGSATVASIVNRMHSEESVNKKPQNPENNNVAETEPQTSATQAATEQERIKMEQKHLQLQYQLQKKRKNINKYAAKLDSLEPEFLTKAEREVECNRTAKEIEKLNECFKVISRDIHDVNLSTMVSLTNLIAFIHKRLDFMTHGIVKLTINHIHECLKAWKEAKEVLQNI